MGTITMAQITMTQDDHVCGHKKNWMRGNKMKNVVVAMKGLTYARTKNSAEINDQPVYHSRPIAIE